MILKIKKENWKITWQKRELNDFFIRCQDWDYIVKIEKKKEKRSISQNAYYNWVVLKVFMEYTGSSQEDLHYFFKNKFLSNVIEIDIWWKLEKFRHIKSTTDLNKKEFEEYLSKIRMFASDQGLCIPLPNEDLTEYFI